MAKIIYTEIQPLGVFNRELTLEVDRDRERAVYTDGTSGDKLILYGRNLKESDEGHFKAGTVDKLVFKNGEGEVMIKVTEGDFKARHFNAGFDDNGVFGIYQKLLGGNDRIEGGPFNEPLDGGEGNDRIIGGRGEDTIFGGAGDDVLTGGRDTDGFEFSSDDGVQHDRITDFDISGEDQDLLQFGMEIDRIRKTNDGKDTMIIFDNGSTLELDHVTKAHFVDYLEGFGF